MNFEDEKDYIMRIIKETSRALFSLLFGEDDAAAVHVAENTYEVAGKKLRDLLEMADRGKINEAENIVWGDIDYQDKYEVAAAVLFYQHLSEKDEEFLEQSNYSLEEVLEGMRQVVHNAGYGDLMELME